MHLDLSRERYTPGGIDWRCNTSDGCDSEDGRASARLRMQLSLLYSDGNMSHERDWMQLLMGY